MTLLFNGDNKKNAPHTEEVDVVGPKKQKATTGMKLILNTSLHPQVGHNGNETYSLYITTSSGGTKRE